MTNCTHLLKNGTILSHFLLNWHFSISFEIKEDPIPSFVGHSLARWGSLQIEQPKSDLPYYLSTNFIVGHSFFSFLPKKLKKKVNIFFSSKQLSPFFLHKKFKSHFIFILHQSLIITIQTKNQQQNYLPNGLNCDYPFFRVYFLKLLIK